MRPSAFSTAVLPAVTLAICLAASPAANQGSAGPGASRPSGSPPAQQPPAQQPPAQQPPTDPQEPARAQEPIRTGINYVTVDVIVTDRNGKPVLDLKPEDFTVTEDGKPQVIDNFQIIKIDPVAAAEGPAPTDIRTTYDEEREAKRPDVRLFILLLDDYHVRRGNDMAVRKPLIDFIQNQLAPSDMVAIMYPLTPVSDLTFTRNRESLISAIEHFEGRRFDYQPRNEFEERYAYYPAATVERIRNQVVLDALKGAAVKLGSMREGRKAIIYVSEGFSNTLPPQLNDPVAALPGLGNYARGRPDLVNSDRVEFFNNVDLMNELQEVFTEANRNNTSIYAVDPKGLAAFEYDINHGVGIQVDQRHLELSLDTLRALASNTDGRAIINRNDLAVGMKQIISDLSGYYLLGYNSSEAPIDGKFHEIKVRVNRRGVDVRARKGYWAYTAEDAARATAPPKPGPPPAITSALAALAEPPGGRPARFWIGTGRGENGRTRVTFSWEPIAPRPGEPREEDMVPARVMLTAMAADGRPLYRGRVPEEPEAGSADGGAPAAAQSKGAQVSFEAPPGPIQMRIAVEGSRGQVLDSTTRELTLPDFTTVTVSLGTPKVYRARTPRDLQNIRNGAGAPPTADRTFSRTERLLILADAYAPGGAAPDITARLLNRNGDPMTDLPVQTSEPGRAEVVFPLANLATGDYLIQIMASSQGSTAEEYVALRVER